MEHSLSVGSMDGIMEEQIPLLRCGMTEGQGQTRRK
jgi:hypothetical protein